MQPINHPSIGKFVDPQPPASSKHDSQGHANFIGRNRICYSLPVSNASDPAVLNVAFAHGGCKSSLLRTSAGGGESCSQTTLTYAAVYTGPEQIQTRQAGEMIGIATARLASVGGTNLAP